MKFEQSSNGQKQEEEKTQEAKEFFKREDILRDLDEIFSNMPNRAEAEKIIADKYSEELGDMDSKEIFSQWMGALKERLSASSQEEEE